MAPSAIETITTPTATQKVRLTGNVGPYKELAPIGYSKEIEEEGKDGFQAAKVSPFENLS
jgi:sulfonate dioxygenase